MKFLKRSISLLLLFCLVFSLAACAKTPQTTDPSTSPTSTPTTAPTTSTTPVKQTVVANTDDMTDLQKAVVVTAESYYLRGKYAQYDQYNQTSISGANIPRRQVAIHAPEDYTSQNYGYTDCSGFVYDVYLFALGLPITDGERNTKAYTTDQPNVVLCEYPEKQFSKLTTEELAAKEKEFRETLQPGDIIVYRNAGNGSGHAMLYVGNGKMFHSTGSVYNYDTGAEKAESNGTVQYASIDSTLLNPEHTRYLFGKYVYVILRPLNQFSGQIPADTQSRMELMRGVMAEKLSSCSYGQTAGPGDTVTFTFRIKNSSSVHKDLTITDTLSPYLSYVSGAQFANGNVVGWTVKVHAGQTLELTYTAKVSPSAPLGEHLVSNSTISGVKVNCPEIKIAKTLTEAQQKAVLDKLNELKESGLQGLALVNAVYEGALGKTPFAMQTTDELWTDLTKTHSNGYLFKTDGTLTSMIAPHLYGGRVVGELESTSMASLTRTRLLTKGLLIPGDVVVADSMVYIFTGDALMRLDNQPLPMNVSLLTSMLANKRFVVLRPSMTF